jgi:hypothetical protein
MFVTLTIFCTVFPALLNLLNIEGLDELADIIDPTPLTPSEDMPAFDVGTCCVDAFELCRIDAMLLVDRGVVRAVVTSGLLLLSDDFGLGNKLARVSLVSDFVADGVSPVLGGGGGGGSDVEEDLRGVWICVCDC